MSISLTRRILAVLLALTMLLPALAFGEGLEGEDLCAVSERVEAEVAATELLLGDCGGAQANPGDPVPVTETLVVDPSGKAPTHTMRIGDTVKLRVKDATVTAWTAAKAGFVAIGPIQTDEEGQYVEVTAKTEIKKLKLTAAIANHPKKKKKASVSLVITNPYAPTGIAFSPDMPTEIPMGTVLDLSEMVSLTPDYAVATLSYKASGAGKVSKDGVLTTAKAGKVKLTVSDSKNKKVSATISITVLDNKVTGLSGAPGAGDFDDIEGKWTLWPLSVGVGKKGGLDCQFYVLNATGDKASEIENMELKLAVGTEDNVIGLYSNKGQKGLKASVASGKSKVLKLTMKIVGDMTGVFLPDCQKAGALFFDINYKGVQLKGKKRSYAFRATRFPAGATEPTGDLQASAQWYAEASLSSLIGVKIGVTVADLSNNYYQRCMEALGEKLAAAGATYSIVDGANDVNRQISQVANFITTGCDLIMVHSSEPDALERVCAQARDAGIQVMCWDDEMSNADVNWLINNYDLGVAIGTLAGGFINDHYTAESPAQVIVLGYEDVPVLDERAHGIEDGLTNTAGSRCNVVCVEDGIVKEQAATAVEEALERYPNARIVAGIGAGAMIGADEVFHSRHGDGIPADMGVFSTDVTDVQLQHLHSPDYPARGIACPEGAYADTADCIARLFARMLSGGVPAHNVFRHFSQILE